MKLMTIFGIVGLVLLSSAAEAKVSRNVAAFSGPAKTCKVSPHLEALKRDIGNLSKCDGFVAYQQSEAGIVFCCDANTGDAGGDSGGGGGGGGGR